MKNRTDLIIGDILAYLSSFISQTLPWFYPKGLFLIGVTVKTTETLFPVVYSWKERLLLLTQ